MAQSDHHHLLRVLGVAFGIAVVVGGTIGQGILRTPGLVAQGVPDARLILLLWLVGGAVCAIDAMSTVELAASIRKTGGPYIFARTAFGPFVGLSTGITDWLANMGTIAFVSVVFGEYLHRLGIATEVPIGGLAAALPVAIGLIQWGGTLFCGRSQELGSALKALIYALLIGALLLAPRGEPVAHVTISPAMTLGGVVVAIRGVFGTYYGWNSAAYFCEEVRDPGHSIVRATFWGLAIVTLVYVMMNVALLHVLTPGEMANGNLVAADAAARVFGPRAEGVVTAISLVSLVTIVNVAVMMYPRVLFAVARDANELPGLSAVAANGTPRVALTVTVVAASLLATVGVYETLLAFSVSLIAAMSAIVNAAAIVLRVKQPDMERPYRMPLFPLPAAAALLINTGLLVAFVGEDPIIAAKAFGLLVAVTATIYALFRYRGTRAVAA
jgi:APA family basic amino acid/polyamine antiporter